MGNNAHQQSLCWQCNNAVPGANRGCSWSRRFKPVSGWEATETVVRCGGNYSVKSFMVYACPEFEGEESKLKPQRKPNLKPHLKMRKDGYYMCRYKNKYFYGETEKEVLEKREKYKQQIKEGE